MVNLVLVESPAKAKKIAGFLGEGWRVEATRGHLRDLPQHELGVELDAEFQPTYEVLKGKGNLVKRLAKAVREAETVYLATDPDREGEAIAWHVLQLTNSAKTKAIHRLDFHAITETAVKAALAKPRKLDMALVEAQTARRIVDRLLGFLVSPLASKHLQGRFSAGRVQTIALRLLVEREAEIQAFQPESFWTISAELESNGSNLEAKLYRIKDSEARFKNEAQAQKALNILEKANFWVAKAGQSVKPQKPPAPFTTSSLQQAASQWIGLAPERTMVLAQKLYEDGWISYHRTDNPYVASEAQEAAREYILSEYGQAYLPATVPHYKSKALAQEAHEAIRPTDISHLPSESSGDGAALYALIWKRFIASQMASAQYQHTGALIQSGKAKEATLPLLFKAESHELVFEGYKKVYHDTEERNHASKPIPSLTEGQILKQLSLTLLHGQTQAPSRFNEASLIKKLDSIGVGRPSTYASTLALLKSKGYASVTKKQLVPTESGKTLCGYLLENFPQVFDLDYSAQLEADLDKIASGEKTRLDVLEAFWHSFQVQLARAAKNLTDSSRPQALHLHPVEA